MGCGSSMAMTMAAAREGGQGHAASGAEAPETKTRVEDVAADSAAVQNTMHFDPQEAAEIEREDADSAHRWSSCIPTRKTRTSRTSFPTEHQCTVRTFR